MEGMNKAANSRLEISEDVLLTVARLAALDVKGVAGLDGEMNAVSKLRNKRPISVSLIGDVAAIDIKIVVNGDAKACTVAQAVQAAVKENVQNMTGVTVARVNVTIGGVKFE